MKQQTRFKDTEIGMIPEDWDGKELKEVTSYITEKINIDEVNINNFVSTENMLSDKGGVTLASSLPKTGKVTQFKINDVLFSNIRTYFKKLWLAKFNGGCSNDVLVIRPKSSSLNNKFLFYFLSQNQFFDFTVLTSKGTKMPRGDKNAIMGYQINIPPGQEQKSITKIFSDLDSKIELNQQMNKTLEAIGQAIFKHWFIDFEFPDEKGRPYRLNGGRMVDSELVEIPNGWKVSVLPAVANVIDCLHTKKPEKALIGPILLQVYNISMDGTLDLTDKYPVSQNDYEEWIKNIEVKEGDCLITNAGRVGAVAQVPFGFVGGLGRNITAIRPVHVSPTYLFRYLFSSYGLSEIEKQTDQGTVLDSLNVKGIKKIRIVVPPREILDKFDTIARPLREKVERNKSENDYLIAIRDSLLPKLMSGRIRAGVAK